MAERVQGFFQIGTGFWLMYLVFAVALNFVLGYTLPLLGRSRPIDPAGAGDDLRTAADPPAALAAPRPSFPCPHARPATTTRRFALSPDHRNRTMPSHQAGCEDQGIRRRPRINELTREKETMRLAEQRVPRAMTRAHSCRRPGRGRSQVDLLAVASGQRDGHQLPAAAAPSSG
jgi:hypothetical protein